MTAAFAYDLDGTVAEFESPPSPAEDLAVAWAIIRLVERTPGTVVERRELESGHSYLRALSQELDLGHEDFVGVLRAAFALPEDRQRLEALDPPSLA